MERESAEDVRDAGIMSSIRCVSGVWNNSTPVLKSSKIWDSSSELELGTAISSCSSGFVVYATRP